MRRLWQSIKQLLNFLGSNLRFLLHQTTTRKPSFSHRISWNQLGGFSCGHDCPEPSSETLNCSPRQSTPQLRSQEKLHCIAIDESQLHLTKCGVQMNLQHILVELLS